MNEEHMSDDEMRWITHLPGTDGGIALLKWLELKQAAITRQFLSTPADEISRIAALQAKMHSYCEIRDLLNGPEEEKEDEGTRETRFALG